METLVINPVKRRRRHRRRTTTPTRRRRRRTNPIATKSVITSVVYTFLGLTAAILISKSVSIERKWLIGLVGAGTALTVGKKVLKKNATPVAIGFGLSALMNVAAQTSWLKGTFSDYMGCPYMISPYQNYIDAGSEQDMLAEGGTYMDYWLDPSRGGVTTANLGFSDSNF